MPRLKATKKADHGKKKPLAKHTCDCDQRLADVRAAVTLLPSLSENVTTNPRKFEHIRIFESHHFVAGYCFSHFSR